MALAALGGCGGGGDSPGGGTANSDTALLQQLATRYNTGVDGKFVYRYTSANFGEHPNGQWTVYRLAGQVREDWQTNIFGFDQSTIAIKSTAASYVCTRAPSLSSCKVVPESDLRVVFVLFTPVREVPQAIVDGTTAYEATRLPDETIAGVTGRCFEVKVPGRIGVGQPGSEEAKICFSDSGALLSFDRKVIFSNTVLPTAELHVKAEEAGVAAVTDFQPISPPQQ